MYKLVTVKDSVRVPPTLLGKDTKNSVQDALKSLEGRSDKDLGVVLTITKVLDVGEGRIIFGDGGVYYDATYEMLVFNPEQNELVEGEVIDLAEFGVFVRVGPMDGLVHVSQITEDFMDYSKEGQLTGKESKRALKQGDQVRARIITISTKQIQNAKVGLTMRQPGLGKLEWLEEARKGKTAEPAEKPAKEEKPKKEKKEKEKAELDGGQSLPQGPAHRQRRDLPVVRRDRFHDLLGRHGGDHRCQLGDSQSDEHRSPGDVRVAGQVSTFLISQDTISACWRATVSLPLSRNISLSRGWSQSKKLKPVRSIRRTKYP